jgi:nitrogen-specific signal transduction histidine kinase
LIPSTALTARVAAAVLEGLPWPAALLDRGGRVSAANRELGRLLGERTESIVGRPFHEAFDLLPGVGEFAAELPAEGREARVLTRLPGEQEGEDGPAACLRLRPLPEAAEPLFLLVVEPLPDEARCGLEVRRLEMRLAEARVIKHDISNALMGVMGIAEQVQRDASLPAGARERAAKILAESDRMRKGLVRLAQICSGDPSSG